MLPMIQAHAEDCNQTLERQF